MNFKKAVEILGVKENFTSRDLTKAYYKKALKFHPDKIGPEGTEAFQNIQSAYIYLKKGDKMNKENIPINFHDILRNCIHFVHSENKWETLFIDTTIQSILLDCKKISLKVFEALNKERALEVYDFLCFHKEIFSLSEHWLIKMKEIIKKKMKMDNIIILNPRIEDMLDDSIYKLELNERTFYIPLWHNEICYDISGKDIIVKCIPELEDGITMDNENNIYCTIHREIKKIFKEDKLIFTLGNKVFEIPAYEFKIKPMQLYVLYEKGLACINDDDIYNIERRGNIYLKVYLN